MIKMHKSKGFTIIEITLAMAFISVLLLSITLVSIQAGKVYNRGVILRDVNQSGREISDTLRRDFLQTNAKKITKNDSGDYVITVREGANDIGSRVCLGSYSYVWNYAKVLNDAGLSSSSNIFKVDGKPINLVRVADPGAMLCAKTTSGKYPTSVSADRVTHLLKQLDKHSGGNLAIHQFSLEKATKSNDSEALFKTSFVLGTSVISEIDTANQQCKPPTDNESNIEFCAINRFEMIVRTNG